MDFADKLFNCFLFHDNNKSGKTFLILLMKISDGSNTILLNINRTRTSFFESNIEPNRAFTKFTKLIIELTRTSFFRTSNEFKRVHLLEIELGHPIFAFERSNIEFRT